MTLLEELRDLWGRFEDLRFVTGIRLSEYVEWSGTTKDFLMANDMRWDHVSEDYIFPDPRWDAFCEMWTDIFCGKMKRGEVQAPQLV